MYKLIPKFAMNCCQQESPYLESPCYYQMNSCKYGNDKLVKKPCKPLEGFEYSSLFSSKTYSILSYIVGGFVGSKSQMNNNHNLSFDLSSAIFNLLNPCKYERDKCSRRSNDTFYSTASKINPDYYEKYILNQSSQKSNKCLLGVEMEWFNAMPLQGIVGDDNYVLAFNDSGLIKYQNKNGISDSKFFTTEEDFRKDSLNFNKNMDSWTKHCDASQNKNNETHVKTKSQEEFKKEMPVRQSGDLFTNFSSWATHYKDNECQNEQTCIRAMPQANFSEETVKDVVKLGTNLNFWKSDCHEKDEMPKQYHTYAVAQAGISEKLLDQDSVDFANKLSSLPVDEKINANNLKLSPHDSINSLKQRYRQQSECSVESTDSDSFIVFEELVDFDEDKRECEECLNEEGNSESDDEVSSCDDYDAYLVDRELVEANDRWRKNYEDVIAQDKPPKKVRFNDDIKINKIVAWDYAYRAARPGPWEQFARDRVRFRERILRLSPTLSPVLRKEHRDKIYKKLYS